MSQGYFAAYMEPPETEKLSRLRSKTDRQILDFIHSKLDLTSSLAALAEAELSQGDAAAAQESLGRADRAFSEAQNLLLVLHEHQRRSLERKLNEVSAALERVCRNRELVRPLFFIARSQWPG